VLSLSGASHGNSDAPAAIERCRTAALADPALTHSEVFIAGTEPFPPVQEGPPVIALGLQSQPAISIAGKGTLLRADEIVLISDARGRKVYINTGALLSTIPSPGSLPLAPTPPSVP
jgi:hypothetical protein